MDGTQEGGAGEVGLSAAEVVLPAIDLPLVQEFGGARGDPVLAQQDGELGEERSLLLCVGLTQEPQVEVGA